MVYVTSDLHGYPLADLQALLDGAGFTDKDFLVILGDVIDRGEHGAELLRWIMEQDNVELLLGNHELMMLGCDFLFSEITDTSVDEISTQDMKAFKIWQRNGAEPTLNGLKSLGRDAVAEIVEYLRECPLYEDVVIGGRRFVLTHGGLGNYEKGKTIEEYEDHDLVWYRPELTEEFDDGFTLIVGHTPTWYYGDRYKGKMIRRKTWINIDTGAAMGLDPMLLRLDDMKAFYADHGENK